MTALDPYHEELRRHERTLASIRADHDEMLRITVRVFINGYAVDKHPNVRAANDPGAVPTLLWNGDIVAEQPEPGLILLSERTYPVTSLLEDQLRQSAWVKIDRVRGNEDVWIQRNRLAVIVREWMSAA